jgi:AmmeMemoRadiSam system radical SAM enzyme
MDAANIDLKGFSEGFYKSLCSGRLAPVLETLEYLKHQTKVWFEITTLLIPGENDSPGEIEAESAWVMDRLGPNVPLHFTAFHPDWKLMNHPPTPPQTLLTARRIAMNVGLRYVYTGNVHDPPVKPPIVMHAATCWLAATGTTLRHGVCLPTDAAPIVMRAATVCLKQLPANGVGDVSR